METKPIARPMQYDRGMYATSSATVKQQDTVQTIAYWFKKGLTIILMKLTSCYSYAEYDLFKGFGGEKNDNLTTTTTTVPTTLKTINVALETHGDSQLAIKYKCPEEEKPINIGSYEVPTQRDLVLMTKTMLTKLFNAYNQQVLLLIKDVKEATKASVGIEKRCEEEEKPLYRKCVKQVSMNSELIMKNLFAALKNQKRDVAALTDEKICNLSSMTIDPLELIKILALENASLQFALPGFLRLLSVCSHYCSESQFNNYHKKSSHRTNDLELVVKHFLTQNNYIQFVLNKTQ